jgi:predicted Zn-dependent protease
MQAQVAHGLRTSRGRHRHTKEAHMDRLDTVGATGRGELGGVSESRGIRYFSLDKRSTPRAFWAVRMTLGAALMVALGGCTANLADAVRERLPGGDHIPPEAAQKIGKAAGDTIDAKMMPKIVDHLGDVAFEIKLKTCKRSDSPTAKRTAEGVSQRIIKAVEDTPYADTGRQFAWRVEVVDDEDVNAMAFPGGKIIVNSGLVTFATAGGDAADAWVATALAHEVTHALARHATEAVKQALGDTLDLTGTGMRLTARDLSPKQAAALLGAMGVPYEGAVLISFAREKESEADHNGLLLMAHAGYDPGFALDFWQRRAGRTTASGLVPEFLSLHPTDAKRISQLRDWIPEAKAQMKATGEDGRLGLR